MKDYIYKKSYWTWLQKFNQNKTKKVLKSFCVIIKKNIEKKNYILWFIKIINITKKRKV